MENNCEHIFDFIAGEPYCTKCKLHRNVILEENNSTQSGDIASIINKAGLEKFRMVFSPDWEDEFNKAFPSYNTIPNEYDRDELKSFIQTQIIKAREEGKKSVFGLEKEEGICLTMRELLDIRDLLTDKSNDKTN